MIINYKTTNNNKTKLMYFPGFPLNYNDPVTISDVIFLVVNSYFNSPSHSRLSSFCWNTSKVSENNVITLDNVPWK